MQFLARHGAVSCIFVGPKIATIGTSRAAAMCIEPLSLVMKRSRDWRAWRRVGMVVCPQALVICFGVGFWACGDWAFSEKCGSGEKSHKSPSR